MSDGTPCTYCGGAALEWDHVISVKLLNRTGPRFQAGDWIVPACCECNGLLSDRMLNNIPTRAGWLYQRYRTKYKKLLTNAVWSDEELDELTGSFKMLVIETMLAQAELDRRLAHLRKMAAMDSTYLQPR